MANPKISVIIPIYRVEPYLRKCVESVLAQTYQNLEIILVDDGSPDNCGAICDVFAAKDSRVRVIHQKNSGVSAARNAGLAAAGGEWIGWVDSDDWIEPKMFEMLLRAVQETGADISVCGHWDEYRNRTEPSGWPVRQIMNTEQALGELLENGRMKNLLWDRLFHRTLFDNIPFPEGRTYEDIAVMHWLFLRAQKVVCLPERLYHYRQREGSIVDDVSLGNRINHYTAAKERYDALSDEWPQFDQLMEAQCVASAVGIWAGYFSNPRAERRKYRAELRGIAAFSAHHYRKALEYMNLGLAGRLVLRLTPYDKWWAFAAARCMAHLYKEKHGRAL